MRGEITGRFSSVGVGESIDPTHRQASGFHRHLLDSVLTQEVVVVTIAQTSQIDRYMKGRMARR